MKDRYSPITPMVDFTPEQLHEGKSTWYISFEARHPETGQLREVCYKFNRIRNLEKRRQEGIKLCKDLTIKLAAGWNPFVESQSELSICSFKSGFRGVYARESETC
ncbi:hypothetical protein [Phaeocystidibacter marisrubri]|uniref:Uncharacterized protein n=1 Tax=Phaeocystidibacter marisrubri TaxID=1577780 RepID=A0A6L3ZGN2_9FLAO|nr:hypothetical protein [Phaeocystidibacter marisrubri]KAB2816109.1 hypothetical protein F8C82_10490 [Phaeocystidibacter marisrubri]